MNTCILACELHDYIEIVCLYGYQIRVTLKNNDSIEGKALDIITADQREYLLLGSDCQQRIDLTQLAKLQVLTANAKFTEISF